MKFMTKSLLGAGAAAAALVSVAAPAQARDRYDRHRDGISAGEIIAGAVVLGGLAAVLSAGNNDRYYDGDRNSYRGGNSRFAVNQCINNVERWANGYSRSEVTQIRDIQRTRYGYRVKGNVVVQDGGRAYNDGYGRDRYYQGNRYDRDSRYNWNPYGRGYDKGRFTCTVERGRVVDIDYKGLEQWR
ncbi:hypothetical protein [Sphingorhabdus sp.]|uniref:hypothetical protein n=1 Tax=Sphingorhabdus sp. TaxID=1902408 RepID=UPI00391C1FAD